MKKCGKIFIILILVFMVLGVTACKNWMSGGLFNNVEEEVKIATAEKVNLYVRFADNSFGTTSPSGLVSKKVDVVFDLTAVTDKEYGFYKWTAFSTENINPKKNTPALLYDEEYMTKYEPLELPDTIVTFEDPYSESTKCKINDNRPDIVIVPVVAKRASLYARNTYPKVGAEDVVRNQRIVISFDKKIDFSSVVKCTNPGEVYAKDSQENNIYYTKDESSGDITQYFYTWDYDKIRIQVYDGNGNELSEEQSFAFFNLPIPDEKDAKKIIITPSKNTKLPRYAQVDITIYKGVVDYAGYNLKDNETYYYSVGKSDDEGYPVFTELKGGRPRILGSEDKQKNTWSDFYGYMDPDSTTDFRPLDNLPLDSKDIDDWLNSGRNNPFPHRVRNCVDLCVIIHDTSDKNLTENKNISDSDIDHFEVRSKHLVNPDGTPGTGLTYSTTEGYSYHQLKYHSGGKNFTQDEPGNNYDDPEDGYAFPYYFPADLPDGLIKVELFAVDLAGNTGYANPFAIYVIKDTTSPDISTQKDNIEPVKAQTLNTWYNETTIEQLKFKLKSGKTISDTAPGQKTLHQKFTSSTGSKVFWSFGADKNSNFLREEVKSNSEYGMKGKLPSSIPQGPVTFYVSLSDDVENVSAPVPVTMDVNFDSVKPENTSLLPVDNGAERLNCYPLTGTEGGSERIYYSPSDKVQITLSSKDSGDIKETEKSSGIAGFFVKTQEQTSEQLASSITSVVNGNFNEAGFVLAEEKEYIYDFITGTANTTTPKSYWLYSVDYALNVSEKPTKLNVARDTKGPDVVVTDKASRNYDSEKIWYKDSESFKNTASSNTGSVPGTIQGLPEGKLYYNKDESGFPLGIELKNTADSLDSGAYYFKLKESNSNSETKEQRLTKNGDYYILPSGKYQIVALDQLGNETQSALFDVLQDSKAPLVTNLAIHGKDQNDADSTSATISDQVFVSFSADDSFAGETSTGVLSFTLSGDADFSNASLNVSGLSSTDYEKKVSASKNEVTFIITTPDHTFTNTKIENIKLNEGDGNKTISVTAIDRTRNQSSLVSASIFIDNTAPTLENVKIHSNTLSASDGTNYRYTNSDDVYLTFTSQDLTSGVKKVYVTTTALGSSGNASLLTNDSVFTGSQKKTDSNGINYLEITSFTGTSFNLPEVKLVPGSTVPQGEHTVYVTVFDDAGNRNEKTVSIIYDNEDPDMSNKDDGECPFRVEYPSSSEDLIRDTFGNLIFQNGSGWNSGKNELVFSITEKSSGIECITLTSYSDSQIYSFKFTSSSKIYVNNSDTPVACEFLDGYKKVRFTDRENPALKGEKVKVRLTGLQYYAQVPGGYPHDSCKYSVSLVVEDFAGNAYSGDIANNNNFACMILDKSSPSFDSGSGLTVSGNILEEGGDKVTNGENLTLKVTGFEKPASENGYVLSTGVRKVVLENGTFQDNVTVKSIQGYTTKENEETPVYGENVDIRNRYPNDADDKYEPVFTKIKKPSDSSIVKRNDWKFWLSDDKKELYFVTPLSLNYQDTDNLVIEGVKLEWGDTKEGGSKYIGLKLVDAAGNTSSSVKQTFNKDTSAPEIKVLEEPYTDLNKRLYDKDAHTVYYSNIYASYEFVDSYLKDYVFSDKNLSLRNDSSYTWTEIETSGNSIKYDFTDIEKRLPENHNNAEIWINVRDKMGNISSMQLKHGERTKWICDNSNPVVKSDFSRLYSYGETLESRYVIKGGSGGDENYYIYRNSEVTEQTVDFTSINSSTLSTFFTDTGSGLFGWSLEEPSKNGEAPANTNVNNAISDFKNVKVEDGKYIVIYDNVGGYGYFKWKVYEDSKAPVVTVKSAYPSTHSGKNAYLVSSTLSQDSSSPTNLYIQSKAKDDYFDITFNAVDGNETAEGYGPSGIASVKNESGQSLNVSAAENSSVDFTWSIGKEEDKTEANSLLKSITISDYVGHQVTYYVRLVSDTTAPVLSSSDENHAPFVTQGYSTSNELNYYTSYDSEKNRTVLICYGTEEVQIPLSTSGIADGGSSSHKAGLPDQISWYSDQICATKIDSITVTPRSNTAPVISPSIIYTKDRLGNILTVSLNGCVINNVDNYSGTVITTEKMDAVKPYFVKKLGQAFKIGDAAPTTEGVYIGIPSLEKVVYIGNYNATVSFKLENYEGKKYKFGQSSENLRTWINLSSDTINVSFVAGNTYKLEFASRYNSNNVTTYQFKVVQDNSAPTFTGSLFPQHEYTSSEKYYTDGTYTNTSDVYKQKIYIADSSFDITLPDTTGFQDSTGVYGFGAGNLSAIETPLEKFTLTNGTASFGLYDLLGNKKTISLEVIKPALPGIQVESISAGDTSDTSKKTFSQIATGTNLSGSYSVGTNDASVILNLKADSVLEGAVFSVSQGGTVSGNAVTLPSSVSGETYIITVTDKVMQTKSITVTVIKDCTGPVLKTNNAFVPRNENLTGSSPYVNTVNNYWCDGEEGLKNIIVYSKESSVKVLLEAPENIAEDTSGIASWADASGNKIEPQNGVLSVSVSKDSPVTLYVMDNFGNISEEGVTVNLVQDTQAPVFDSDSGNATVIYTAEGGTSEILGKFYGSGNTIYYSRDSLCRLYMNISGLSDDASGVFLAGLAFSNDVSGNPGTAIPGNGLIDYADWENDITQDLSDSGARSKNAKSLVKNGVAKNVFLSFSGNPTEFYLYLRDKAGNIGHIKFNLVKDMAAPSLTYTGEGAVSVTEGSTIYTNGKGTFTVTDTQSGVKTNSDTEIRDNVGNGYVIVTDTEKPSVSNASYVHNDQHKYSFTVKEADSGISKIVIRNLSAPSDFQIFGNNLGFDNSALNNSRTVNGDSVIITLPSYKKVTSETEFYIEAYYGNQIETEVGNGAPSNVKVGFQSSYIHIIDAVGNEGYDGAPSANQSVISRIAAGFTKTGTSIVKKTSSVIRSVFVSPVSAEKTAVKGRTSEVQKNTVLSDKNKVVPEIQKESEGKLKKVSTDIRRLAENQVSSESSAERVEEVTEELWENKENTVNVESQLNSQNVVKQENIIDNYGNDIYNKESITKRFAISIILFLLLICSTFVYIKATKSKK